MIRMGGVLGGCEMRVVGGRGGMGWRDGWMRGDGEGGCVGGRGTESGG